MAKKEVTKMPSDIEECLKTILCNPKNKMWLTFAIVAGMTTKELDKDQLEKLFHTLEGVADLFGINVERLILKIGDLVIEQKDADKLKELEQDILNLKYPPRDSHYG